MPAVGALRLPGLQAWKGNELACRTGCGSALGVKRLVSSDCHTAALGGRQALCSDDKKSGEGNRERAAFTVLALMRLAAFLR